MRNIRTAGMLSWLIAAFLIINTAHAREALIRDAGQLSANQMSEEAGSSLANLIDGNASTGYHSRQGELAEECYIRIDLEKELDLGDREDLVFFTQRCALHDSGRLEAHPTSLRVEGSFDGVTWEPFCHVYFLYRGNNTREYSERIRTDRRYRYLRLTVTANNARMHDSVGHRYMGMAEFQIYKIGRDEAYEDGGNSSLLDRLHLKGDYNNFYRDYSFVNTQGILDPVNHCTDPRPLDVSVRRASDIGSWLDWGAYSSGKWNKDKTFLDANGIVMPDFTCLTSAEDPEIAPGQKRQRTHVTEHILYAVPGDAIALYPYYQMASSSNYYENFSHWYDYNTGGRLTYKTEDRAGNATGEVDLLDFLIDPSEISKTDRHGYFGGSYITPMSSWQFINIGTVDEYLEFARRVNSGETSLNGRLTADLDFSGREVTMIGTEPNPFQGVFDGGGHRVSNMVVDMPDKYGVGVFSFVGRGGRVMDLHVDSSCRFHGNKFVALIAILVDGTSTETNNLILFSGLRMSGEVVAEGVNAAGIVGSNWNDVPLNISDCLVDGKVTGGSESASLSGYIGASATVTNSYSIVTEIAGVETTEAGLKLSFFRDASIWSGKPTVVSGCYDSNQGNNLPAPPADLNSAAFISNLGDKWIAGQEGHAVPGRVTPPVALGNRYWGTVGTFFMPRNPYVEEGLQQSLPQEYVIAADFSQSFALGNIDHVSRTIHEPVIHFRHIFRIKDGKSFADEFSSTPEKNAEYIRKNMRHVSARAGIPFQIRFDSPVPASGTTRSKFYYKISDSDYRRVCTMRIRVLDADTRRELDNNDIGFYPGEEFDGQGSRKIDGITYNICGGGGKYYRMLKCDRPREGRFLVQMLGNDINGNPIKIQGTNVDLVVMEMQISFLPETAAFMITEEELYSEDGRYSHARESELDANYGAPKDKVDFDEYALLESAENVGRPADYVKGSGMKYLYRLPVVWDKSTYTFGYDSRFDYSMYMLSSHSDLTPYHVAADSFTDNYGEGKGLYDRLFYKTRREGTEPKRGYFYYVNAAQDPGVMARLNVDKLCLGSTIHVSAWVAEFSSAPETANLAFNFVAVMNNGERVPLHSFVTGYIDRPRSADDTGYWPPEGTPDRRGQWLNVYYSFVPNYSETGISSDNVDHYELELDNNCKNSGGADYAVDNIRVYISQPVVYGKQLSPVCDKETTSARVRIESPYEVLLQTIGETEAPNAEASWEIDLYYTFIEKRKFDLKFEELVAAGDEEPGTKAYEEAVLRYRYRGQGDADQTFGRLSFKTHFMSNPEYDESMLREVASRLTDEDGHRMIVFNTEPNDENLSSGKEYYIALYTPLANAPEVAEPGWKEFDIKSDCAKVCVFRVKPTSVIKIDGELRNDNDDIACCENQSPVVQVNVYGLENGELTEIEKNAYMDWFDGTNAEYMELSSDGIHLSDAMACFRNVYPSAETADVEPMPESGFTEEMRDYIRTLSEQVPEGRTRPLLSLYRSSYVFDPVKLEEGEEYRYLYVLALPIVAPDGEKVVCAQPTEVRMKVRHQAPELYHGLRDGISYPDDMTDVPLRIGLAQLGKVSAPADSDLSGHAGRLNIPVRKVRSTSQDVSSMTMGDVGSERLIYLVETNDPMHKDLGTLDGNDSETGTLLPVGEIVGLVADVSGENGANVFSAVFYDDFMFREGYYYRMRFMFRESGGNNGDVAEGEEEPVVCDGQDVFTIKIVPEYMKWSPDLSAGNSNWNNDSNWSRVTYDELYVSSPERKEALAKHVTDGNGTASNDRGAGYAPLEFTKVVIPSGELSPRLFPLEMTDLGAGYPGAVNPDGSRTVMWPSDPSHATDGSSPAGEATPEIEYDMAAYSAGNENIDCRPWYAYTCGEVHFRPESEISGQKNLVYSRAWVDVENRAGRWYTLALPLKSIYAGDMYLPSAGARQETELFSEITYTPELHNRFSPAVFQRGWNRSSATVFEIKDGPSSNVAVKADWSHVYNDVREEYGFGNGFSIKTDVSAIGGDELENVLFRLPKSDTWYDYYSHDGNVTGNRTDIQRPDGSHFRLNDAEGEIRAVTRGDNGYYLVGNPFMSHLDMAAFLTANSDRIYPKYWILTEGSQQMAVFDETSGGFVGSATGLTAPLQGFFVEAREGAATVSGNESVLKLRYDETMSCLAPYSESPLKKRVRSGSEELPATGISVAVIEDGNEISRAFVDLSPLADIGYDKEEDVILLDHSAIDLPVAVYTVSGNTALSVNRTPSADGVEIGLTSDPDDEERTLVFEGTGIGNGLMLHDTHTGEYTDLYDGLEYNVKGAVAGRLFLVGERMENEMAGSIKVSVSGGEVKVSTVNSGGLSVSVHDMLGARVMSVSEDSTEINVALEKGIYLLEAADSKGRVSLKIMVK